MAKDLLVAGAPDEVLLWSVTALRRLGARITRYDVEALTLEARVAQRRGDALVRLRAAEAEPGRTRLAVAAETASRVPWLARGRSLVRRFARELACIATTPMTGRTEER
ncbi:MAG: hypothetical protein ACREM3_15420 [Candidatus Rokuibacteriota bacterium]